MDLYLLVKIRLRVRKISKNGDACKSIKSNLCYEVFLTDSAVTIEPTGFSIHNPSLAFVNIELS